MPHELTRMLTIAEAVSVSRIGRTTLYALIRDGKLDARKIGRRTLVPTAALDKLLQKLPRAAGRAASLTSHPIAARHGSYE